jgi:hypothetical protein
MSDGEGFGLLRLDNSVGRDDDRSIAVLAPRSRPAVVAITITAAPIAGPRSVVFGLQWYDGILWLFAADRKRRLMLKDGLR